MENRRNKEVINIRVDWENVELGLPAINGANRAGNVH